MLATASGERLTDPSGHNPISGFFDYLIAANCAVDGPALANNIRIMQMLRSLAIGFIPGVGDAYFLLSSLAGQDLITGTKLSQSERVQYAGMAAFSLATMIVGASSARRHWPPPGRWRSWGELERVGSELAHGAETEARAAEDVGHAAEGVAREASAAGRDLSAGADAAGGRDPIFIDNNLPVHAAERGSQAVKLAV